MQPMLSAQYQDLQWNLYPGLVRVSTIADGSCFFHAIARAYFEPYILGRLGNRPIDRSVFIQDFRRDLARKLAQPIDPLDPTSPLYYDTLSRGRLEEMSKSLPQLSLDSMVAELDSRAPVDNKYNEFISNLLGKDIYLLDYPRRRVYITGDDDDILYKSRPSIVLLVTPGHYDLVGLRTSSGIQTLFPPSHDLITKIRALTKVQRSGPF